MFAETGPEALLVLLHLERFTVHGASRVFDDWGTVGLGLHSKYIGWGLSGHDLGSDPWSRVGC